MWRPPSTRLGAMYLHDDVGTPEDTCGMDVELEVGNPILFSWIVTLNKVNKYLKCQRDYCLLVKSLGAPVWPIPSLLPILSIS